MIAVIFEVEPKEGRAADYFKLAAELRPLLETIDGFMSIERFESLSVRGKVLSLSYWRDEASIAQWRALEAHRTAQALGRDEIFRTYRLRIGAIVRDYGMDQREQAPADSRAAHRA